MKKANELPKNKLVQQQKITKKISPQKKKLTPNYTASQKRKFTQEKNKDNEDEDERKKKPLSSNSSGSVPFSTFKSANPPLKKPSRNVKKSDDFKYGKGKFGFKEYYFPL